MWEIRNIGKAKKQLGVKMEDARLRNTNARWYGMIKVIGVGPKYRDGMRASKPAVVI